MPVRRYPLAGTWDGCASRRPGIAFRSVAARSYRLRCHSALGTSSPTTGLCSPEITIPVMFDLAPAYGRALLRQLKDLYLTGAAPPDCCALSGTCPYPTSGTGFQASRPAHSCERCAILFADECGLPPSTFRSAIEEHRTGCACALLSAPCSR